MSSSSPKTRRAVWVLAPLSFLLVPLLGVGIYVNLVLPALPHSKGSLPPLTPATPSRKMQDFLNKPAVLKGEDALSKIWRTEILAGKWPTKPQTLIALLAPHKKVIRSLREALNDAGCIPSRPGPVGRPYHLDRLGSASRVLALQLILDARRDPNPVAAEIFTALKRFRTLERECNNHPYYHEGINKSAQRLLRVLPFLLTHPALKPDSLHGIFAHLTLWNRRKHSFVRSFLFAAAFRKKCLQQVKNPRYRLAISLSAELPLLWPWYSASHTYRLNKETTHCALALTKRPPHKLRKRCAIERYFQATHWRYQGFMAPFGYNATGKDFLRSTSASQRERLTSWYRYLCASRLLQAQMLEWLQKRQHPLLPSLLGDAPRNPFTNKPFPNPGKGVALCDFPQEGARPTKLPPIPAPLAPKKPTSPREPAQPRP